MWHTYLDNCEFLCSIYDDVPPLENVDISTGHAGPDGPTILFRLDLPRYADHPPKAWHSSSNTVALSLVFFGCGDLDWKGWEADNICNIEIKPIDNGLFVVQVSSNVVHIKFTTRRISSKDIEPRCRDGGCM